MVVAKRQGREKPAEIEQRKVRGPERGPQVEQTALLATPIYRGQAQGEEKHLKRGAQSWRSLSLAPTLSLFSSHLLGQNALTPRGRIFLYLLNKTDLPENYSTDCPRAVTPRALTSIASNFCWDETELKRLHSPDTTMFTFLFPPKTQSCSYMTFPFRIPTIKAIKKQYPSIQLAYCTEN